MLATALPRRLGMRVVPWEEAWEVESRFDFGGVPVRCAGKVSNEVRAPECELRSHATHKQGPVAQVTGPSCYRRLLPANAF